MILHPGIIALLTGALIEVALLIYSSYIGLVIIMRWNANSSTEEQLSLERKTYLVSTIMSFVLAFSILSTLLFIYTVDGMHRLFTGAMCATGSLNANPVGWYALYMKISIFFLASIWIAVNYIDQRTEDSPLVKKKFILLLCITPFLFSDIYLQFRYFLGLKPNIITSCCGSLFSKEGGGMAGGLSGLPTHPMEYIFFSSIFIYVFIACVSLFSSKGFIKYLTGLMAIVLFIISLASIISFISLYFYEIPTHHCPFDILQGHYNYIGYPLYISLFGGTVFGILTGVGEGLKKSRLLTIQINNLQRKWTITSIALITIFALICIYPMIFSSFTLEGY